MDRKYTLRPSPYDPRDRYYTDVHHLPAKLPMSVDLRPRCPPVWDQGPVGTCHAEAVAGDLCVVQQHEGIEVIAPSVLFLAYNTRMSEGNQNEDSGGTIRGTIKSAASYGVCCDPTWPYLVESLCVQPPVHAYAEARHHMAIQYQFLSQVSVELRGALANGDAFVGGFRLYESFESAQTTRTGIVPLPRAGERYLGAHAMLVVGYDDMRQRFLVRNSWGAGWGLGGHCWVPYNYLLSPRLSFDLATIQRAT